MTARLVSVSVVARLLGVSPWTVRRYVESGRIPSYCYLVTPGGHYRFRVEIIAAENKVAQTGQTERPTD